MKVALLSRDAGCVKSYAISMFMKKLRSMDVSVVVTDKDSHGLMLTGLSLHLSQDDGVD